MFENAQKAFKFIESGLRTIAICYNYFFAKIFYFLEKTMLSEFFDF